LAFVTAGPLLAATAQTQIFPGGFLEKMTSATARPAYTDAQIQAFVPARGAFTFPTPYNTAAVRITNASDCAGGGDCVVPVGYSYWANINNHVGSDTMLIALGLSPARGGTGPTLFSYNKVTEQVSNLGPMFDVSSKFRYSTVEGWYFSAKMPNAMYMMDGSKLVRYDVITHQFTTVFDVANWLGSGLFIWQTHSSGDDLVHIGTVRSVATSEMLGCAAYHENTGQFSYFPARGILDECHLDKSGRWMVMLDNVDRLNGEDNRIIDLTTGTETLLMDQAGAAGHADMGYGYMVAEDNWAPLPGAIRMWKLGQTSLTGQLVYSMTDWSADAGHMAHGNSVPGVAPEQQYVCNSNATRVQVARSNEIVCYRLDSSGDVMVVAPVMTDLDAPGGGDDYSKRPKANIDVTGQYMIWTTNMGGNRLDAIVVKVPSHLLSGTGLDVTPPVVAITSPLAGASLSGSVTISGTASDDVAVAGVQFRVDGVNLGAEDTSAPFAATWNTGTVAAGQHTLTAVARDAAGNSTTSAGAVVNVAAVTAAPVISSVTASALTVSGGTISWTTSTASDSQVVYGLQTNYISSSPRLTTQVTGHQVTLSGLAAGTMYHYRVVSVDSLGRIVQSGDYTFTTPSAGLGGLVGSWKLSDTDGFARDATLNHYDGTLASGAAWAPGWLGQGIAFDGVNDFVYVPHHAALDSYPLTVLVSVKTAATGLAGIVNKYYPSSSNGYQIFTNGGKICAWYFKDAQNNIFDGTSCTLAVAGYNDNKWHQVAFVVDLSGGTIYVDGVMKATRPWTGTPGPTTSQLTLSFARYPGISTPYLAGSLDEVQIYNRSLTTTEIKANYDQALISGAAN
jgi:hypothetical protein